MGGSGRATRAWMVVAAIAVFALNGCGESAGDDGSDEIVVRITDAGFEPERVRVEVGDPVTFVNRSATAGALRSEDGGFTSRPLPAGGRRTIRFPAPAVHQLELGTSPFLDGTVVVGVDQSSKATAALHVTRDFGRETLWSEDGIPLHERETLLRQLRSEHDVALGDGGTYVEGIGGWRADYEARQPRGWVTNVNGIETDVLAIDYGLYDGDVVQWDLRDWYVTLDVRATVGAFPQTFTQGLFGRTFPVRVACAPPGGQACGDVRRTLRSAGVRIDGSREPGALLPPPGNPRRALVVVGPWRDLRSRRWMDRLDAGPRFSGIFARFTSDTRALRLLDWDGRPVRDSGPGTGLVGAMRPSEEDLVWLVTGIDDAGVERAAAALSSDALRDAFAVAVTPDGVEKLPLPPRDDG